MTITQVGQAKRRSIAPCCFLVIALIFAASIYTGISSIAVLQYYGAVGANGGNSLTAGTTKFKSKAIPHESKSPYTNLPYSPESDMCLEAILPWELNHDEDTSSRLICRLYPCHYDNNTVAAAKTIRPTTKGQTVSYDPRLQRGFAIRYPTNFGLSQNPLSMQIAGGARSGSGCAMSREYGFLFVHNLKVGGTNTKTFLKEALCSMNAMDKSDGIQNNRTSSNKPNAKRKQFHFRCSRGGEWMLQIIGCKRGLQEAKENSYFVWSFVRNPFARLYSGYAMAEGMFWKLQKKKNPNYNASTSFPSFQSFALATNEEREHMSPTSISHYQPQAHFLADVNECPLFDYVGRLESYEADLLRVIHYLEEKRQGRFRKSQPQTNISQATLQWRNTRFDYYQHLLIGSSSSSSNGKIQVRQGTSYGKRRQEGANKASANDEMRKVYSDDKTVQHVVEEYKVDFDLFGYNTDAQWVRPI